MKLAEIFLTYPDIILCSMDFLGEFYNIFPSHYTDDLILDAVNKCLPYSVKLSDVIKRLCAQEIQICTQPHLFGGNIIAKYDDKENAYWIDINYEIEHFIEDLIKSIVNKMKEN